MRKYKLECPIRKANPYRRMAKALKTNAVASEVPKKEIPLATDKQIALIKKKMEESEEIAEKYKNLNFEKLNIYTAKKIIGEILS